jgi:murein DD-endopeptidase MepM/ murein hydrolase activator NlpD
MLTRLWFFAITTRLSGVGFALMVVSSACAFTVSDPIKIVAEKYGDSYSLTATNRAAGPYQIILSFTKAENISVDRTLPIVTVVPRHSTTVIGAIRPGNPRASHSFGYKYSYRFGDPSAKHDRNARYRLPFEDGKSFRIGQAWGGPLTTHNSPESQYAVDIPMPNGTPVVSARSGIVVEVIRPFDEGKQQSEYLDKANSVRILHSDGTWAVYAHLTRYTSNIYPGQWIQAGTNIGVSGNSGYSSGPHLHFVVQRNNGERTVSIPFVFENRSMGIFPPKQGLMVPAD